MRYCGLCSAVSESVKRFICVAYTAARRCLGRRAERFGGFVPMYFSELAGRAQRERREKISEKIFAKTVDIDFAMCYD